MKKSNAPAGARTPFQKWVDKYQGLFYLIPWIIGFLVFKAFPFGQSLYYSFTDMNFFKDGTSFVGLANYITAFHTRKITKALIITFKYAFITVPLKLIFALFIAYILNFKIACVNLFRTVYYIPSILGGSVAIAVLWKAVFSVDGLLNTVVRAVTFGAVHKGEAAAALHFPDQKQNFAFISGNVAERKQVFQLIDDVVPWNIFVAFGVRWEIDQHNVVITSRGQFDLLETLLQLFFVGDAALDQIGGKRAELGISAVVGAMVAEHIICNIAGKQFIEVGYTGICRWSV